MMNFASQKRSKPRKRRISERVEEVQSQQYMTDLEGILTDGGEFNSAERERSRKSQTQNRVSKSQLLRAENISSVDVRGHETATVNRISPEANKKQQKEQTGQNISPLAVIACRQCARRVDLSEQKAAIIAELLERDFTISNCTKVLCNNCAANPRLPNSQKCMRYCENPEKCERYPLVDFFVPLYCEWQKMYCLKTSYDYSEQLLPKQIESEKQKMNNRITSYKVEYSKKQNRISELQTMRQYLMLKSKKMAEDLQKAFNDNNTLDSRNRQMAHYLNYGKEIFNHCDRLRERAALLKMKYGQASQFKSSLVEEFKKMRL